MVPDPEAWRISHALGAVLAGLTAAVFALLLVGGDATVSELFGVVAPAQSLATIATMWLLVRGSTRRRRHLGLRPELADWWGLLMGAGLQVVLAAAMYPVIQVLYDEDIPIQDIVEAADRALSANERILVVVSAVLLAPLAEELVFRGALLQALRQRVTDRWAGIFSAVAFAAFHMLDPNAYLATFPLFALGLVMARRVIRTGRIAPAVAIHMGFNLVSVIALFVTA